MPYFSSRESLNQLVALLKLSKYFYQFEGIFIGLHAEARNRVRSVVIVLSCIHTKRNWKRTRNFLFIFVIFLMFSQACGGGGGSCMAGGVHGRGVHGRGA